MAKKDTRQESEPTPDEPNPGESERDSSGGDGDSGAGNSPLDETTYISNEDSTPDVEEDHSSSRGLMETTVEGLSTPENENENENENGDENGDDDEVAGQSTVIPDPDDTVIPEDAPDPRDQDATARNLDSTIRIETRQHQDDDAHEADEHATTDIDPSKKTVADSGIDQTVAVDAPRTPRRRRTKVSRGQRGDQSDTTINIGHSAADKTVAVRGSIMTSGNVGETVNPRDLSPKDAALWNSAVGKSNEDPSVLPPAIDRTFSDKQFDRLRHCNVAPLKSDMEKASDYRLVRKLGQGGMGDVFVARQGSLDRLLALKLIKPLSGKKREQLARSGKLQSVEDERRQQFLSEAIVTGDLDHPNIVPIHDVALTSNNELFYAMKRVVGTPWSDVIKDKSRDENIEILLKAADAIGFAHTRGVVHRDIKPENIMLGDFGVVMVMDWGLALPTSQYEKQESIFSTSGLGGTPAFMAPEMATGPLERIGPASDIYLLGATLFMIITGSAPHRAKNVTECLKAVRTNAIREVREEQQGELLNIALKAMETRPEDRYPDVESFQKAIRDYRAHAESIALASRPTTTFSGGDRTSLTPIFRGPHFASKKRSSCGTETKRLIAVWRIPSWRMRMPLVRRGSTNSVSRCLTNRSSNTSPSSNVCEPDFENASRMRGVCPCCASSPRPCWRSSSSAAASRST